MKATLIILIKFIAPTKAKSQSIALTNHTNTLYVCKRYKGTGSQCCAEGKQRENYKVTANSTLAFFGVATARYNKSITKTTATTRTAYLSLESQLV